jgi:hypothetical protein
MALKRLCVMAALSLIAAVSMAPNALAASKHVTLAPAGYEPPGNSTVVVAGTPGAVMGPGDHVVICHAIGGANGDRFIQIAPSAGTVFGHDAHEGDRDIIPPFVYENGKARNTSLSSGNNWTPANSAIYSNGCVAGGGGNQTPPADVCPNIDGMQSAVPAGMVKDQAGNCLTPATPPQTQPLGPQTQPDAPQTQPQAPGAPGVEKAKTARKAKTTRKAKTARKARKTRRARNVRAKTHRRVKAKRRAATNRPRVLPFTP